MTEQAGLAVRRLVSTRTSKRARRSDRARDPLVSHPVSTQKRSNKPEFQEMNTVHSEVVLDTAGATTYDPRTKVPIVCVPKMVKR